jgi:adenylylsulfate kinase
MRNNQSKTGGVVWITGLSGAGKSTVASIVVDQLRAQKIPVVFLDGDQLRGVFNSTAAGSENHGFAARKSLAMQYAHLCNLIASQGIMVVIATISLFREVHKWNRENIPAYFEAYLQVPIEELRKRDPKGLYSQYDAGKLTNVAGLDLKVDEPESPDWHMKFDPSLSAQDIATDLLETWKTRQQF